MAISVSNEDKRPSLICPHCKAHIVVDIRPFNTDLSRLAEYTCNHCRKKIYAGLILLCNTRVEWLAQNIQTVIDSLKNENTNILN